MPNFDVQRYSRRYHTWITFDVVHTMCLEKDDGNVLLVKVKHIQGCTNFDLYLARAAPRFLLPNLFPSVVIVPPKHLRRDKGKARDPLPTTPLSHSPPASESDPSPVSDIHREHPHVKPSSPLIPIVKPASMGNLMTCGNSRGSPIEVEQVCVWPVDFFMCDIAEGFRHCGQVAHTHHHVTSTFEEFFGVPFTRSTFLESRLIWNYTDNLHWHEQCTRYGRTPEGTWHAFMAKAQTPECIVLA